MNTDPVPFDLKRAIGLTAARALMRGKGGRRPAIDTVRRWASLKKGCRPTGKDGPAICLRVVRFNGELLTMPEWVEQFEQQRVELAIRGPDREGQP